MANPHSTPRSLPQNSQKTPSSATAICFPFHATTCLHNWWLFKTKTDSKGRRLGVGGFAFREGQGKRVFHSEAIVKRHDANNIETVDGITITVIGCIDRPQTRQNGFPSKVSDRFLFGFPCDWEEYAAQYCCEESTKAVPSGASGLDGSNSLPNSFDDFPVTRVRDLLMSTTEDSEYSALSRIIFNDILRKCGGNSFKHSGPSVHSIAESNTQVTTTDSVPGETPRDDDKTKVEQKYKNDICVSHATSMRTKESHKGHCQSKMGVATRSMTRSKNITNEKEENLSNTTMKRGLCKQFNESVAPGNKLGGMITKTDASNASQGGVLLEQEMQIKETHDKSAVRIPITPKNWSKTRKNASNVCDTSMLSGEGTSVKETPVESALRRSKRQKNLKK